MLHQEFDKGKLLITYFSKSLTVHKKNYLTSDCKELAVVMAIKHWYHHLQGVKFLGVTDYASLAFLYLKKELLGRILRWVKFLMMYHFNIFHQLGSEMVVSNTLSRLVVLVDMMTERNNSRIVSNNKEDNQNKPPKEEEMIRPSRESRVIIPQKN